MAELLQQAILDNCVCLGTRLGVETIGDQVFTCHFTSLRDVHSWVQNVSGKALDHSRERMVSLFSYKYEGGLI